MAAQEYNEQPITQSRYIINRGGLGTVAAIITLADILNIQAITSTTNLIGCDLKSLATNCATLPNIGQSFMLMPVWLSKLLLFVMVRNICQQLLE